MVTDISEPMTLCAINSVAKRMFFLLLLISPAMSYGQMQMADSLFIVTYTTGKSWDHSKQPTEQTYFKSHSTHLSSLRKSGVITAGARYSDKGIIIIRAESTSNAKHIIESDTAVSSQLFNVAIDKLSVFYPGCLER